MRIIVKGSRHEVEEECAHRGIPFRCTGALHGTTVGEVPDTFHSAIVEWFCESRAPYWPGDCLFYSERG